MLEQIKEVIVEYVEVQPEDITPSRDLLKTCTSIPMIS